MHLLCVVTDDRAIAVLWVVTDDRAFAVSFSACLLRLSTHGRALRLSVCRSLVELDIRQSC